MGAVRSRALTGRRAGALTPAGQGYRRQRRGAAARRAAPTEVPRAGGGLRLAGRTPDLRGTRAGAAAAGARGAPRPRAVRLQPGAARVELVPDGGEHVPVGGALPGQAGVELQADALGRRSQMREHLRDRPVGAVGALLQLAVGQRPGERAERVVGVPQGFDEWRGVVLQRASPFWATGG